MLGQIGIVREPLDPEGLVLVHGELWKARAGGDEPVPAGAAVTVEQIDEGLVLRVAPSEEPVLVHQ